MRPEPGRGFAGLALLLALGCATGPPPETGGPTRGDAEPSEEASSLLVRSGALFDPVGPVETNRQSLEAAREVLALEPGNGSASLLAARAASWLLEFDTSLSKNDALALAQEGRADAETALAADGDQVGPVFLTGALLGQELLHGNSPGLVKMRRIEEHFERALSLDPSYDQGAPYRALGTLLVKAPPWPVGVGDDERGLELLEEGAHLFPDQPASHLFLGDALASAAMTTEATESYERVITLCLDPGWGTVCETYGTRARKALDRLR